MLVVLGAGKANKGFLWSVESESDAQLKPSESTHISGHAKNAALQVAQLCRVGRDIIKGKIGIKLHRDIFWA